MEHLPAGPKQQHRRVGDRSVDRPSPRRSTGNEEHGLFRGESECRVGLSACARTVELLDLTAEGHADDRGIADRRVREDHADVAGEPCAEAIGDAGLGVGLVNHQGDVLGSRCEVGRRRGVSSEADNDVDAPIVDKSTRPPHQLSERQRKAKRFTPETTRRRQSVNDEQLESPRRHEAALEPLLRAKHEDRCRRLTLAQPIGHSQ